MDKMLDTLNRITQWNKDNGIVDVSILADSTNKYNERITSFLLHRFPKGTQAQLNTHKSIAKNSASSRAINKQKYIDNIKSDYYVPIWTYDKPGMVGDVVEDVEYINKLNDRYIQKMNLDIEYVEKEYVGIHKQDSSSQLDKYVRIPIIVTSTNFPYFFDLRCHYTTKPEFRRIALEMQRLFDQSKPVKTAYHIPWIREHEQDYSRHDKLILSTARSAWLSYSRHDKLESLDVARNTVEKLWSNKHYSCFDHCARFSDNGNMFKGWQEYRNWYDK